MARLYNPMARILDFESKIRVFLSLLSTRLPHFFIFATDNALSTMRKTAFFSCLLIILCSACSKTIEYETLVGRWPVFAEVYALKDTLPDSALRLAQQVADTLDENRLESESPYLFNEYQVLKTELKYKNYIPVRNDSLIEQACDFYETLIGQTKAASRDGFLQYQFARSLYYKAVVESQRGQTMASYADFMRCLGVMDELTGARRVFARYPRNLDYVHFTALTYTRMASFLYRYDAWNAALEVLGMANESFEKEHNALGVADNFELMGDIMIAQSDRTAALQFYRASDSIHEQLNDDNVYRNYSTLIHESIKLFEHGMSDSAYRMLHRALELTENDYNTRKICFALGHFYYEDQTLDSALANYERSIPLLPRQTTKALCRIVQIANDLGDTEKLVVYGARLADNEMEQHDLLTDKTKMISMYTQYMADKREAHNKSIFLFITSIVVLLLLVLVIDTIWLEKRRRRHQEDKEQHRRIKSQLEQQLEGALEEARHREKKISELEAELEKTVGSPDFQQQPFNKKMEVLMKMPICLRACKVLDCNVKAGVAYPELALTDHHLGQLVNAVDSVFPNFSVRMIEQYPRLNRSDVIYCCLYILGINEIQAAALTGKTYQAVWKRSTKLHEIFGNNSDLMFFLHNILKDWK